jgi:hypothetical protein
VKVVLVVLVILHLEKELVVEAVVPDHPVLIVVLIMVELVVLVFRHQIHSGIQAILLEHLDPQMVISTLPVVEVVVYSHLVLDLDL